MSDASSEPPAWQPSPAVDAELRDAFQFTNPDGSRHGYVTRAWVETLLATEYARGRWDGQRAGSSASEGASAKRPNPLYWKAAFDHGKAFPTHIVAFSLDWDGNVQVRCEGDGDPDRPGNCDFATEREEGSAA